MNLKKIQIHNFKGLDSVEVADCGSINALVGKNNSGKSSVLHAIDMAGLALSINTWNSFQPKLEIKDLFGSVGDFHIDLEYEDGSAVSIRTQDGLSPIKVPPPNDSQIYKSILVWPDVSAGMKQRLHRTPKWVLDQVEQRQYANIDSLQILDATKFYALRNDRNLTPKDYTDLLDEVREYFPEISAVESDRTENDIATLFYEEYGKKLDIIYSGSGLKHFIDILLKVTISGATVVLLDEPEMGLHPDLQRRFIEYLHALSEKKGIQIFLATHSQVLLNYADSISYFRVFNSQGKRNVVPVPAEAIHTLLSDFGIRPSDVFNQDMCLMVEGASEVVFFEYIIRVLYKEEFEKIAVGILQYGGSAADGIISKSIDVTNISPSQKYTYWIRDRDAKPTMDPSTSSTKFKNAIMESGMECKIWDKREIEYYYPEEVVVAAQQGDEQKEQEILTILHGDQADKFRKLAAEKQLAVPSGKFLRRLLQERITSSEQIDPEVRSLIEDVLIPWKKEILGEE